MISNEDVDECIEYSKQPYSDLGFYTDGNCEVTGSYKYVYAYYIADNRGKYIEHFIMQDL